MYFGPFGYLEGLQMKEADNCETSSIGQVEGVYRDIGKLVRSSKVIMMIMVMSSWSF